MNKEFVKKVFVNILQVVIIFMTVFGVLITFEYVQQGNNREEEMSKVSLYQKRPDGELVRVLGETAQSYEGDRFIVQDITLGGETLMAMIADDKTRGIEISHLQGRLYQFSEDEDVNYYASWQSNKPTLSAVSYKKESDAEFKEVSEDNFGYVHTVILSDIDFSSVYHYVIKSRDRWGKEIETGQFVFYTGAEEASFFQLLEESFGEVFGWMAR